MSRTRAFKSGNSQAVRIPAEIAYANSDVDLEITRSGDVITIFPARGNLKHAVAALRGMPKPLRAEKRSPIEIASPPGLMLGLSHRHQHRDPCA